VKARLLAIGWVLVAVVFVLLLLIEVAKWRALGNEVVRARSEREQLTADIQLREQQLVAEMRKNAELLQEMQWTSKGTDPSTFLTRMAELAREKRMKVMGIGPLEQQSSPQFNKSWHTVQVQAPYREIRDLAARIEQDKGILEDVHMEAAPAPPGQPAGGTPPARDEIQARFKMTALELSPQAKAIIERALAATGSGTQVPPGSPLALSVPTGTARDGRDPFSFLTPPGLATAARPPGGSPAAGSTEPPSAPLVPLDVKGVVSFPDGFLAIVNNQIVKVGDTVNGHRVERITDDTVTFREPGATPRTVKLPELAPASAAEPRR
jgi:hypothetical protein